MAVTRDEGRTQPIVQAGAKRGQREDTGTTFGLLMVAPAMLILILVLLYPAFVALQTSFYRVQTITREETWVGLGNYSRLLVDPEFWKTSIMRLSMASS